MFIRRTGFRNKKALLAAVLFISVGLGAARAQTISAVANYEVWQTSATITWLTDTDSDSRVDYGPTTAYGSFLTGNSGTPCHIVSLSALQDGMVYHYKVRSGGTDSADYVFITDKIDTTPPEMGIVASVYVTSATIMWTTTEQTNAQVARGPAAGIYTATTTLQNTNPMTYQHSVWLTGLSQATLYHYQAYSTDAGGFLTKSGDQTFTTKPLVGNIPPNMSVSAVEINVTSATVKWVTGKSGNTQIHYDTNGFPYASQTTLVAENETCHTQGLAGLTASTLYHYSARTLENSTGIQRYSTDRTFSTRADVTAPAITAGPAVSNITSSSASVTWTTDEYATSVVEYDTDSGAPYAYSRTGTSGTSHTVNPTGLNASVQYYYRVRTCDPSNNCAYSSQGSFTTLADTTPPVITGPSVINITPSAGTVIWTTNETATSVVEYGTTVSYGGTQTGTSGVSHSVLLSGLSPSTLYHYRVRSKDPSDNEAVSGDNTFTTGVMSVDHFRFSFTSGLPGPGVDGGDYPNYLYAGDCYAASVEALDSLGNHNNYTGQIVVTQWGLTSGGADLAEAPGLAVESSFILGKSSVTRTMTNGYAQFAAGSGALCFYLATRAPQAHKGAGEPGDLRLKAALTANPGVNGVSDSYIVWHKDPYRLMLLAPDESLAPATASGRAGTLLLQRQGKPFALTARLVDQYYNQILNSAMMTDRLRFSSSLPRLTGLNPVDGAMAAGRLVSSATVDSCNTPVQFTVEDIPSPLLIYPGQVTVTLDECNPPPPPGLEPGFFEVTIPVGVQAGQPFQMTIIVRNVNIPGGSGSVNYSGVFTPLTEVDQTPKFTTAAGLFGVPTFQFSVTGPFTGTTSYVIPDQTYTKAESIWLQLTADNPGDLAGAAALNGRMDVSPGEATKLTVAAIPAIVLALSNSILTATVTDDFLNGVGGISIAANITQGAGNIGGSRQVQAVSNANGQVTLTFTSGRVSETNKILFSPDDPSIPDVEAAVLTSLIGPDPGFAEPHPYPNPFNPGQRPINFEYKLETDSDVVLSIFDLFGQLVWKTTYPPGSAGGRAGFNTVQWNGRNGEGRRVAVGIYVVQISADSNGQTVKKRKKFGVVK